MRHKMVMCLNLMIRKMLIACIVCILSALLVMPGCASEFIGPEFYDWNIKCCPLVLLLLKW